MTTKDKVDSEDGGRALVVQEENEEGILNVPPAKVRSTSKSKNSKKVKKTASKKSKKGMCDYWMIRGLFVTVNVLLLLVE